MSLVRLRSGELVDLRGYVSECAAYGQREGVKLDRETLEIILRRHVVGQQRRGIIRRLKVLLDSIL